MKHLDKIANIALIVGVAVFLGMAIRGGLFRRQSVNHLQADLVGRTIKLPQANLRQGTVVLAISTSCHFCVESVPFYQKLLADSQRKLDVVAVLPQPVTAASAFLRSKQLPVTNVISSRLANLGVYATPTVLIVNADGKVQSAWVGLLDESSQNQILSEVNR